MMQKCYVFLKIYARNGSYITAGQQDYAERLNQIESQRENYYRELGIAPGVPTMKGAYGDPENTGVGYNTIITELGDHSVPKNWEQFVVKRGPGETPGPPIIWSGPQDPEDAQPGYGFIADDTNEEETFFYHSDHLGSTSYITDDKGNITQYTAYLPYGELLVDEHSSSEDLPYKFNGKELDEETGLYYYGARYLNPTSSVWYGVDPLMEKYPNMGSYVYCHGNPINRFDPDGRKVKPVGELAFDLIKWGITPEESMYLRLDNDGFIDADFMAQGLNKMENIGENYKALMTLVNSQETIEVIVASQIETTLGIKTMGTTSYESTLNEMYEIEGRSLGLSKKEYQSLHPEYSTTKEWGGWFGISLYPDEGKQGLTTNGNWQVVINSSPRLIDLKEGSKKMTSVFAHEAYGHALFKQQGLPHSHGTIKSLTSTSPENNIRLEKQIHQRENEAEKNYNLHNK